MELTEEKYREIGINLGYRTWTDMLAFGKAAFNLIAPLFEQRIKELERQLAEALREPSQYERTKMKHDFDRSPIRSSGWDRYFYALSQFLANRRNAPKPDPREEAVARELWRQKHPDTLWSLATRSEREEYLRAAVKAVAAIDAVKEG